MYLGSLSIWIMPNIELYLFSIDVHPMIDRGIHGSFRPLNDPNVGLLLYRNMLKS